MESRRVVFVAHMDSSLKWLILLQTISDFPLAAWEEGVIWTCPGPLLAKLRQCPAISANSLSGDAKRCVWWKFFGIVDGQKSEDQLPCWTTILIQYEYYCIQPIHINLCLSFFTSEVSFSGTRLQPSQQQQQQQQQQQPRRQQRHQHQQQHTTPPSGQSGSFFGKCGLLMHMACRFWCFPDHFNNPKLQRGGVDMMPWGTNDEKYVKHVINRKISTHGPLNFNPLLCLRWLVHISMEILETYLRRKKPLALNIQMLDTLEKK